MRALDTETYISHHHDVDICNPVSTTLGQLFFIWPFFSNFVCAAKIGHRGIRIMYPLSTILLASLGAVAAYDVPDNLQQIYDDHKVK